MLQVTKGATPRGPSGDRHPSALRAAASSHFDSLGPITARVESRPTPYRHGGRAKLRLSPLLPQAPGNKGSNPARAPKAIVTPRLSARRLHPNSIPSGPSGLEWNLALPHIVTKVGRDSARAHSCPRLRITKGASPRGPRSDRLHLGSPRGSLLPIRFPRAHHGSSGISPYPISSRR
jgi:hypothetical protein